MKLIFSAVLAWAFLATASFAAEPIREERYVTLGGIEQWITIRGADRNAPALLWIHGGPAEIQSPLVEAYQSWESHYRLVQWDQRGAGRTFYKNSGPKEQVTLERIALDGIELTEHLRKHFGVSKIIVAGHSWGSLVALTMVQQRPELFEMFVGAGQVSSWRETVKWQYDNTLAKARAAGDTETVAALEASGVPPHDDFAKYTPMRRKLAAYFAKSDLDWLQRQQAMYASTLGATPEILQAFRNGGGFSMQGLMPTIVSTDLSRTVKEVKVPVCVIQGDEDAFTPLPPAKAFFDQLAAPSKQLKIIKGAGHFAPMTHTQEFLAAVRECREK